MQGVQCTRAQRCGGPKICPTLFFKSFLGEEGALLEYLHAGPLQPCYATVLCGTAHFTWLVTQTMIMIMDDYASHQTLAVSIKKPIFIACTFCRHPFLSMNHQVVSSTLAGNLFHISICSPLSQRRIGASDPSSLFLLPVSYRLSTATVRICNKTLSSLPLCYATAR